MLEAAKAVEEGTIPPSVIYQRKCRSLLTMKQELEKLSRAKREEGNTENAMEMNSKAEADLAILNKT